jgi:hypothetical protein
MNEPYRQSGAVILTLQDRIRILVAEVGAAVLERERAFYRRTKALEDFTAAETRLEKLREDLHFLVGDESE